MKRLLIATTLSLVSLTASASSLLSVHVFKADDAPVYMEKRVPAGMEITVYSLDAMKQVDSLLGQRLEQEISKPKYRGMQGKNKYMKGMSELINSPEWPSYLAKYKDSLEPIEKSIRYRIKKLPAYVFDNQYIVYGVPSFQEALAIYQRKVK